MSIHWQEHNELVVWRHRANAVDLPYVSYGQACACPSFSPSFGGTPFIQWHEILSHSTRDSNGENPKSLSHLLLEQYWVVTPGQTDRQTDGRTDRMTIANTHYS